MVGDELLSAFKVASFAAFDEDSETTPAVSAPDEESKDWEEIIPEKLRKKVEEEEKNKEMEDLYLPPRSRKTLQQLNQSESDGEEGRGRRRNKKEVDESGASSLGEESDEDRPKKRGRPPASNREKIKNFTDAEVRSQICLSRNFNLLLIGLTKYIFRPYFTHLNLMFFQKLMSTFYFRFEGSLRAIRNSVIL